MRAYQSRIYTSKKQLAFLSNQMGMGQTIGNVKSVTMPYICSGFHIFLLFRNFRNRGNLSNHFTPTK